MTDSASQSAALVRWDLSDLYASPDDPRIAADMASVRVAAAAFQAAYKGRVASLSAAEVARALADFETLQEILGRLGSYAYLDWSTATEDPKRGKLLQQITEFGSEAGTYLVFWDVEYMAVPDATVQAWLAAPETARYRYHLESSRRYQPHILSEAEEHVLMKKSVTGAQAWVRYFDETLGAARFEYEGNRLPEQDVLHKLHDPDREVRRKAHASLTEGLGGLSRSLTYIFNTLLADKATNDELRNYGSWISSRNLSNQISDAAVEALVAAVQRHYPTVQRYYRLKQRLLGLDTLYDYDRYAPVAAAETSVHWDDARRLVTESYTAFHPEMGRITGLFFDNRWIDAAVVPGKRGGAYAASTVPGVHPYVFMNYQGRLRDVQTLAHELGHGVHQYLAREQGVLQADTPLTTAETASVFGEMLVFRRLLDGLTDPKERLALLMGKIDDTIATVFRQISMNRFEAAIHTARREEGELEADRFGELWIATQRELYGDSVTLTDGYARWWSYIPHFLHTPGYVYAYAFGELLVLALYEQYRRQPDGFADHYLDLLRAGGSDLPERIVAKAGVDITRPDFWETGLKLFEAMVDEAEELAR